MILTEKEITERLEGPDLPPSIKEAIQNGLKGVPVSSEQLAGDHIPGGFRLRAL